MGWKAMVAESEIERCKEMFRLSGRDLLVLRESDRCGVGSVTILA